MLLAWKKPREALVFNYLNDWQHPEFTDFCLLWLDKRDWEIHKWRRVVRYYYEVPEDATDVPRPVIKDHYKYVMNWHEIVSYIRDLEWLDKNWLPVYEKIVRWNSNLWWITALNKMIRDNQFNVLRELWKWTPNEPYVKMLMEYYKQDIVDYISMWWTWLLDKINAETDPTILAILWWPTTDPLFATVKDAIIYQITE